MDKQQLETTVTKVLDEMRERPIPLGISNRHIHLCAEDYGRLFPNQPISEKKGLLQPGQYAAEQTVTLVESKGQLKNVRLLGFTAQQKSGRNFSYRRSHVGNCCPTANVGQYRRHARHSPC